MEGPHPTISKVFNSEGQRNSDLKNLNRKMINCASKDDEIEMQFDDSNGDYESDGGDVE